MLNCLRADYYPDTSLKLWLTLVLFLAFKPLAAQEQQTDVIIIGAGLSGLSTAYYLQKAGIRADIVEMTAHIGGRIRTASYVDGKVQAEVGLEEFWGDNPVLEIFRELNIPLESSYSGFSSVFYDGKFYPSIQNNNTEFLASFTDSTEMQAYQQWNRQAQAFYPQLDQQTLSESLLALKDLSFADWLGQNSHLSEKMQAFIRMQLEPEIGVDWQHISALDGIAEWRLLSAEGQIPYHVVSGNQSAVEKMAATISLENLHLNQLAVQINADQDGVEVITQDTANYQQHRYRGKYVVLAIPLYKYQEIQFTPPLSDDRKQAVQSQSGGAYFTAHVLVDSKAKAYWWQQQQNTLPILTDSALGVIYGGKSADPNLEILNLLITGAYAEAFNQRLTAYDDIKQLLLNAFEKQWPGFSQYVRQMYFYRYHPRAIAAWPVGRSRFDGLSSTFKQAQGRIYFAGDFTEDSHSNGAALAAKRVSTEIILKRQ